MSILRGISIRIPLLVYGANVADNVEITTENFTDLVDDNSWVEFMPKGVDKPTFNKFSKYYEQDVFISAGRQIRNKAKSADNLSPTERVKKIVEIFNTFKNPDKETVLTLWRVVNLHLGDCLGGYDFYDENHDELLDEPRYRNNGKVTKETVSNENAKILEINSKSGLYPLYVVYSIYRKRCSMLNPNDLTKEKQLELWDKTVKENIYIICKTPMARAITQRTLVGYRNVKINAHAFDDLIMQLKDKPEQFREKISRGNFWNKEVKEMKFDAIVGNPPYQLEGGSGGSNDAPIYQIFSDIAIKLQSNYSSLILPARWFAAGRENLLGDYRTKMLNNKNLSSLCVYTNSHDVFPSVEIKGGICYYLIDSKHDGDCSYSLIENGIKQTTNRVLNDFDVLIRNPKLAEIVKVVMSKTEDSQTVDTIISNDTPFGISSNPKTSKKNPTRVYSTESAEHNTKLYLIEKLKRSVEYVNRKTILKNAQAIDYDKVFIPGAGGSGNDSIVLGKPEYAPKNSVCTQSYLYAQFNSEIEARNFIKYIYTKFFRALVSSIKISQSAPNRVYRFVPLQDFTNNSDINWNLSIREIDSQLFNKYSLTDGQINYIENLIRYME